MKLAIFGPTGNVGSALVEQALAAGHEVRAVARAASVAALPAGVTAIPGELEDEQALRAAIRGADAVLSTLGPRANRAGEVARFGGALERITRIMRDEGVRRLVSISGAGLWLPGDPPNVGRRLVTAVMKLVARHVLASKAREAQIITDSELDWVLVRPGRIVAGERTGDVRVGTAGPPRTKVTRGDVADFMLRAATGDAWVRQAPMIG
jgi:putative NADH-flavin reductase